MKQLLTVLVIFSITSVLFIACGYKNSESGTNTASETKSIFDLAAAKKAVEEGDKSFGELLRKGDSVGVANLYTTDAKFMAPNTPAAVGRAAIQTVIAGFINAGMTRFDVHSGEVWGYEDLVSEEGTWTYSDKDGKQLDNGKFVVLWKMEDGKWKLFRDCWNSDNPPAK